MGQEMCSVTVMLPETCQNTHSIPLYNIAAELRPPRCGFTASNDSCAAHFKISWEHLLFLDVVGVVVQISRLELEVLVIIHDIVRRVTTERKVTLRANDNSSGITNPFVGLLYELSLVVEGVEWEGKAIDPVPTGRNRISRIEREHCEDSDLGHSHGHHVGVRYHLA